MKGNCDVLIRGEGIAASCCRSLLEQAGLHPAIESLGRPKLPAVMLGDTAQKLLRDIFKREDLFAGLPRIRRRVVAWGEDFKLVAVPHSAVVVSEQELLDRVQGPGPPGRQPSGTTAQWTILATSVSLTGRSIHHFGSRLAVASSVKLKPDSDLETCWIESCEAGWLFLLPGDKENAWLLSVGHSSESLLETSRLVKDQILELRPSSGAFASHPRVVLPLSEPGWIACGTGALAFDPLCGDGVGNAAREAILGSAVIRAAIDGEDTDRLAGYYHARLLSGFLRHIALCLEFYRSGGSGAWWKKQTRDLQDACSPLNVSGEAAFRYRLNGFTLEHLKSPPCEEGWTRHQ